MNDAVTAHLDTVPSPGRRRDADTLIELMERVTGQEPRMWGSAVLEAIVRRSYGRLTAGVWPSRAAEAD
jgi:hypothetical protein